MPDLWELNLFPQGFKCSTLSVPAGDPPNTGNLIRLCANIGAHLHLVKPLVSVSRTATWPLRTGVPRLAQPRSMKWDACLYVLASDLFFVSTAGQRATTRRATRRRRFVFGTGNPVCRSRCSKMCRRRDASASDDGWCRSLNWQYGSRVVSRLGARTVRRRRIVPERRRSVA